MGQPLAKDRLGRHNPAAHPLGRYAFFSSSSHQYTIILEPCVVNRPVARGPEEGRSASFGDHDRPCASTNYTCANKALTGQTGDSSAARHKF
jgi:hypothetical protein